MEARFDRSFRSVRIHTGPGAEAAAAALDARVFCVGHHIVFGADQYDPTTAEGQRLLAHELTHVVQQRDSDASGVELSIGSPDDPLENEADLVAARILTRAPLPPITRDVRRVVRRAVRVDAASTQFVLSDQKVKADMALDGGPAQDAVIFHLTQGLNKFAPKQNGAAFRVDAGVNVSLGRGDSLAGFEFALLQFMRISNCSIFYAGRTRTEGSVGIQIHAAMTNRDWSPDGNLAMPPWISETPFTRNKPPIAVNAMGDHPFFQVNHRMHNFHPSFKDRDIKNFLFEMQSDQEAWTVFSARDDKGKFQHLAHVHWSIHHAAKFLWRGGKITKGAESHSFVPGTTGKGPPPEPGLKGLLASPSGTRTKDLLDRAIVAAVMPPNPHRGDNPTWFPNVPNDFFLP
jgi:hypothetical protein